MPAIRRIFPPCCPNLQLTFAKMAMNQVSQGILLITVHGQQSQQHSSTAVHHTKSTIVDDLTNTRQIKFYSNRQEVIAMNASSSI